MPAGARGVVLFAHGSGSSRHSPRNVAVARTLNHAGIGTLLFDLLTHAEATDRGNVFDIGLLARRLHAATTWLRSRPGCHDVRGRLLRRQHRRGCRPGRRGRAERGHRRGRLPRGSPRPGRGSPRRRSRARRCSSSAASTTRCSTSTGRRRAGSSASTGSRSCPAPPTSSRSRARSPGRPSSQPTGSSTTSAGRTHPARTDRGPPGPPRVDDRRLAPRDPRLGRLPRRRPGLQAQEAGALPVHRPLDPRAARSRRATARSSSTGGWPRTSTSAWPTSSDRTAPSVTISSSCAAWPTSSGCRRSSVTAASSDHEVVQLARVVATFHAAARDVARDRGGRRARDRARPVGGRLRGDRSRSSAPSSTRRPRREVERLVRRYLAGRDPLFQDRIARRADRRRARRPAGRRRLHARPTGPQVLDCLEFDDGLRYGDVLADVAFLAMDLERLGADRLARRFLDAYRELSGESHPPSLEHHYIALRAHIRGQGRLPPRGSGQPGEKPRRSTPSRSTTSEPHESCSRSSAATPGTGKSTLAAGIAERTGWAVLRSDEVRKDLAGIGHLERGPSGVGEGIYRTQATEDTYTELLARARTLVQHGDLGGPRRHLGRRPAPGRGGFPRGRDRERPGRAPLRRAGRDLRGAHPPPVGGSDRRVRRLGRGRPRARARGRSLARRGGRRHREADGRARLVPAAHTNSAMIGCRSS